MYSFHMKLALLTRFLVFAIVAVLAFGPAGVFAAPTMGANQSSTSNIAMPDGQSVVAQPGCAGCPDMGMTKAAMAAYCNAGCFSVMMLPSAIVFTEPMMTQDWALAACAEPSGFIVNVDPYPPNFSSQV
jgi:hypothetical protein